MSAVATVPGASPKSSTDSFVIDAVITMFAAISIFTIDVVAPFVTAAGWLLTAHCSRQAGLP